jgi:hypothetical protein
MAPILCAAAEKTFAERLGWERGSRVLILHCDDGGMSHESNLGIMEAMTGGIATSASVMMPCPWVPEIARQVKRNPTLDIGLHLTLNSEWKNYRWGPLAGKRAVPGLVDREGCLWKSVAEVFLHASPDEVETEIRAQIARARSLGLHPTHLDSHMGTIFMRKEFFERYIKVGLESGIPVFLASSFVDVAADLQPGRQGEARAAIDRVWNAGFPVIDHHVSATGLWKGEDRKGRYRAFIRYLKPGITMAILHPTAPGEGFSAISASGPKRYDDLLAMKDPSFKALLQEEGIVLTTWRELRERRERIRKRGEHREP